jgi:hypothetical protein
MRAILYWFFAVILFGVLRWAFNSFAWDIAVHILQSKFGIAEAEVIAGISSFIVPGLLAVAAVAGAYNLGRRYPVSGPAGAPSSLTGAAIAAPSSSSPQQPWPFLIQAAIILAIASGGVGYYLDQYFHFGEIDPAAIKSRFARFHEYLQADGRHWSNETVRLDGLRCRGCIFDVSSVVFFWNGIAPFDLEGSVFIQSGQAQNFNLRTQNVIIEETGMLLHAMGAAPNAQFRGQRGPP